MFDLQIILEGDDRKMDRTRKIIAWFCILFLCLAGCGKNQSGQSSSSQSPAENSSDVSSDTANKDEDKKDDNSTSAGKDEAAANQQDTNTVPGNSSPSGNNTISVKVGDKDVDVNWENNESVDVLKQMSPLTVQLTPYGGVELTGNIGTTIPSTYSVITANPGDIVLYEGNTLIVMVESKTCQYTKIGKITNLSEAELKDLLSKGNVTITLEI